MIKDVFIFEDDDQQVLARLSTFSNIAESLIADFIRNKNQEGKYDHFTAISSFFDGDGRKIFVGGKHEKILND